MRPPPPAIVSTKPAIPAPMARKSQHFRAQKGFHGLFCRFYGREISGLKPSDWALIYRFCGKERKASSNQNPADGNIVATKPLIRVMCRSFKIGWIHLWMLQLRSGHTI